MPRILVTAFGPYGPFPDNASWMALVELTRGLEDQHSITTRRYPVDFVETRQRLMSDLEVEYDVILHLGQAAGEAAIHLEQVALNVGQDTKMPTDETFKLEAGAPLAYQSELPLADWSQRIRDAGIPCKVSHHAGTYLCNAIFYWTSHQIATHAWNTRVAFVHFPLAPQQTEAATGKQPSLSTSLSADALRIILEQLQLKEVQTA